MKSYNDNNDSMEMDDMNIKSHLNTSLDLSGISVSEDLINRTLAAIKEQPVEKQENQVLSDQISKKVIPWNRYVRSMAGIAAAVLVVVVGINVVTQMPFGSKKDASNESTQSTDTTAYDMATEQAAEDSSDMVTTEEATAKKEQSIVAATAPETTTANATESTGTVGSEGSTTNDTTMIAEEDASVQFTITADTIDSSVLAESKVGALADENGAGNSDAEVTQGIAGLTAAEPKLSATHSNEEGAMLYAFRDIFLPSPELAEYITITDEINNTSLTLTEQADILDFYSVMDQHQFTSATETTGEVEDSSGQNYKVEVKNPQPEALYTLIVGDNLTVMYAEGDTVTENIYEAENEALFKQNLEDFFVKYNQ
jgi:negative regulator of sigma E activity